MSKNYLYNDSFLVKQVANGCETAFLKLFNHYKNDIYRYSMSMLKQKEYAEEIVQDVFLKVWLNRESLNPNLSFKSYVFTITRNLTINFLHKVANDKAMRDHVFYEVPVYCNPIETKLDEAYFEKIKQQAINRLSPKRKRIFELSRDKGMSYDQISEELGVSKNTVKNQMSSALDTIREFLFAHENLTFILFILFIL
ncbi:RNA polymerase sigma factor [Snuella sedimenti]|uniref:RNA polymerase sigma-70 factor n=1 Tax=Snuella sedimenti TaxID=2798802 RepID=A0A8J7ILM4_9FLAO|nr:RNA polymerase sigma-70 factor [Snuella sedimenti]MBJ6366672.1 RNA polymerase sigma-70 factor [Snuella sedimenti]